MDTLKTQRRKDRAPGRRAAIVALAVAAVVAAAIEGARAAGVRLNLTPSAPTGLWLTVGLPAELHREMMVSVCPPPSSAVERLLKHGFLERGNCAAGSLPLLKPVAAIAGDQVEIRPGSNIRVNGDELLNTAPISDLSSVRPGTHTVEAGTIWLLSTYNDHSFDSRYYGAVPIANVRAQAVPLWVHGDTRDLTKKIIMGK